MADNPVLKMRPFVVQELKWETRDVFTLVLKPQDPADSFSFKSGQWVYLHLIKPDGSVLARAPLSILSCPENSRVSLELGIKVQGDFTKLASNLIPDDLVSIQGPFGVFGPKHEDSSLVMFAGGIGITPMLCMLRSLAARKADLDVTLFYSNKTEEDIAYWEELENLKLKWPRLNVIYILTRSAPVGWTGETRRLDLKMLKEHASELSNREFVMCGPMEFMESIRSMLASEGVDTKTRLIEEKFITNKVLQPVI